MKLFNALVGLLFAFAAVTAQAQPRELPDFTDLVERQGPAVVNISTTQVVRSGRAVPQLPFDEDDPMFEFFKRFIPKQPGGGGQREQETKSLGSGFIITPDGYVLTNAHVVESAEEILVKLGDKREFKAKVIGSDKRTDIALIKIEASGLPAVRMGDPTKLRVGEWVVAIGSPFGFESSVTAGIVSAKGRSLPQGTTREFTVTVAEIPDEKVAQRSSKKGAKPEATANRLGLVLSELTAEQRKELKVDGGVVVEEVRNGGRSDLRQGDIILAIINKGVTSEVRSADQFNKLIAQFEKGANITLLVRRGENQTFITLKGGDK